MQIIQTMRSLEIQKRSTDPFQVSDCLTPIDHASRLPESEILLSTKDFSNQNYCVQKEK